MMAWLALTLMFVAGGGFQQGAPAVQDRLSGVWSLIPDPDPPKGPVISQAAPRVQVRGSRTVPAFGEEFRCDRVDNVITITQVVGSLRIERVFDLGGADRDGEEFGIKTVNSAKIVEGRLVLTVRAQGNDVVRDFAFEDDGTLSVTTTGVKGYGPMKSRYLRKPPTGAGG